MSNDFDALVNDLGEAEPEPAKPAAAPTPARRALPWIVVGVVALLVGGGVAFVVFGPGDSDVAAPPASASPSPSPSADPSPEPEAPIAGTAALPTACVDIFSPAYHAELASTGAVLSEGNTGPREYPFEQSWVPAEVESTIAAAPHLECAWTFADNFNVGINTVVAEVTDTEAAEIDQALAAAGFTGIPELSSVRHIKESVGSDGFGPRGYSIIARDGMVIATEWMEWPAAGYTADIVNTVLGLVE